MWSEEELARLHDAFDSSEGGGDVKGVLEFFPGRGIRDVTAQLKMLGLLKETKNSKWIGLNNHTHFKISLYPPGISRSVNIGSPS